MTILVMLPISINGIGLRENSFVKLLLALVGVNPGSGFALSVIQLPDHRSGRVAGRHLLLLLKREIQFHGLVLAKV